MNDFIKAGKEKVEDYLKQHKGVFSDEEVLYYLSNNTGECLFIPDEVRSIFDELGLLPDNRNIYKGFVSFLREKFPIEDMDIIELGGGVIPRVSKRISLLQNKGTITVYDPQLSFYEKENEHLSLIRKKIDSSIKTLPCQLMISLMSCDAIEGFLNLAISSNVDFCFGLCEGGPHGDEFDFYEDEEEWIHSVICDAKNMLDAHPEMGKLKVKKQVEYGNPYPIIYNDRT